MDVSISSFDDNVAAERGRVIAARAIAENPEQKARLEAFYGTEYCKRRYPEAYRSGFGAFLDRVLPWRA